MPSSNITTTRAELALKPVSWAVKTLGVSHDTIRRMISRGELRGFKIGRSLRVDENDVYALIQPIPTVAARGDRSLKLR